MSTKPILQDTTLCSIVRDEIQNAAGGIRKFVEESVPYVERAIIVDTGSTDGTKEELAALQKKYTNLEIISLQPNGVDYASWRNTYLKHISTTWALVLDADEIISDTHKSIPSGYSKLQETITQENTPSALKLQFYNSFPEKDDVDIGTRLRLFKVTDSLEYRNNSKQGTFIEYLWDGEKCLDTQEAQIIQGAHVVNFTSGEAALNQKRADIYGPVSKGQTPHRGGPAPWKQPNPKRDSYATALPQAYAQQTLAHSMVTVHA